MLKDTRTRLVLILAAINCSPKPEKIQNPDKIQNLDKIQNTITVEEVEYALLSTPAMWAVERQKLESESNRDMLVRKALNDIETRKNNQIPTAKIVPFDEAIERGQSYLRASRSWW